ncbi:hypothetical protein ETD86_34830 [Nonomuraea turkmeniaca]|uniref:Uncharacterized protein n=1 Tax=Nonomuraea turkmeniaca TaxID=103838 RepID=A0A5S4F629_9ACTN|nr:hypothetical protein [Nonomuraea turkmeniaca]TMR11746.1 hypothetical protein ETD86_34830 [Nonomuraea turkmeniaca]
MVAGLQVTQAEVNAQAGTIARAVFAALGNVQEFKAWLDTVAVGDLETLGFSTADANTLKSAFSDLADIAGVFQGSATARTLPYDYRTFAKRLIGVGVY